MSEFRKAIIAASTILIAMSAIPSSAQSVDERSAGAPEIKITNSEECKFEGGSIVESKDGNSCLVPMRPEEYVSEVYDGQQFGILECPVDTINDGLYCLYPLDVNQDQSEDEDVADEESDADSTEDSEDVQE